MVTLFLPPKVTLSSIERIAMRASLMDLLVSLIFALVLIFTLVEVVQEF